MAFAKDEVPMKAQWFALARRVPGWIGILLLVGALVATVYCTVAEVAPWTWFHDLAAVLSTRRAKIFAAAATVTVFVAVACGLMAVFGWLRDRVQIPE